MPIELKINCWNNQQHIDNSDISVISSTLYSVYKENICYLSSDYSQYFIKCTNFNDKSTSILKTNMKYTVNFLASGKNFICHDINYTNVECIGSPLIVDHVPKVFGSGYKIINIIAGNNNICFIIRINFGERIQILCYGSPATGINKIPDEINVQVNYKDQIKDTSISNDTICLLLKFPLNYICWGTCSNNMCKIKKEHYTRAYQISVGYTHACTLTNLNTFFNSPIYQMSNYGDANCWGENKSGQSDIPLEYRHGVTNISAGDGVTCAIKANMKTLCWGSINMTFRELSHNLRMISAGGRHVCGVKSGVYECWGYGYYGQTDLASNGDYSDIDESSGKTTASYDLLSAGWDFTCYLNSESNIKCVGFNYFGQTQVPEVMDNEIDKSKYSNISIISGIAHSCAIQKIPDCANTMACWGGPNNYNELDVTQDGRVSQVEVGHDFTCINSFDDGANIICYGNNEFGQLGYNKSFRTIYTLSAGGAHACVAGPENSYIKVYCWGSNQYGQTSIPDDAATFEISAGDNSTCIIQEIDASIKCYGQILFNQYGDPKTIYEVKTLSNSYENLCWVDYARGGHCIGDNYYGQCDIRSTEFQ